MKNTIHNKSGFTLLEIIIVIIIVGVLASLALPKFFQTVEFSRSTEALSTIASLRQAMERCYLQKNPNSYKLPAPACDQTNLDMADPSTTTNPASLFDYKIDTQSDSGYKITATRIGGGAAAGSLIVVTQATAGVTRSGTTSYIGIK